MIEGLSLRRFKGFDKLDLPLAPITVLLGPNSCGKSSVIQALLALKQSATSVASLRRLKTSGSIVDLGWFGNVVHGQTASDSSNPDGDLSIGMAFRSSTVKLCYEAFDWGGSDDPLPRSGRLVRIEVSSLGGEPGAWAVVGAGASDAAEAERLELIADEAWSRQIMAGAEKAGFGVPLPVTDYRVRATIDGDRLYDLRAEKGLPEDREPGLGDPPSAVPLPLAAEIFAVSPLRSMRSELGTIRWLGPLRSAGSRFYPFSPDEHATLASDGANLPVLLTPQVTARVNQWLSLLEMSYELGFEPRGATGLSTELLLEAADGRRHTVGLPDVGSGVAQILPLLALMAQTKARGTADLLVIQQPELHLHPRQQGLLAAVRREVASNGGGPERSQIIVETHSETLVVFLQYLVSKGSLSPQDISLIAFDRDSEGRPGARRIELDDQGNFVEPWPGGFFPDTAVLRRRRW